MHAYLATFVYTSKLFVSHNYNKFTDFNLCLNFGTRTSIQILTNQVAMQPAFELHSPYSVCCLAYRGGVTLVNQHKLSHESALCNSNNSPCRCSGAYRACVFFITELADL